MTGFLSLAVRNYFGNYSGLTVFSWQRIGLGLVNAVSVGACFFLSLYFVNFLHINVATAGLIVSFYGLGTAIGGVISGKLSDAISPRIISIISLFIEAIAFLILMELKDPHLLIVNIFILGVAAYGFKTSNTLLILNQCRDNEAEKLKTITILFTASNLGIGLSALLVSVLERYGLQYIFLFSSFLAFSAAIHLIFQENVNNFKKINQHSLAQIITQDAKNSVNKKIYWIILLCLFCMGLIIGQRNATYSVYLHEVFPMLGVKGVSIIFALNPFLIVLFQTPLVNFFNTSNKVFMVGIGAILMGFGMFVLTCSSFFVVAIFSCIIYTIGEMLFFSMAQLVSYQKGGRKKKGSSMGIYQTTYAMSIVIGPTLGGFLYYHLGRNAPWYLSALIGITCFILCLNFKKYD